MHIWSVLAIFGRGPSLAWPALPICLWRASWSVAHGWSLWVSSLHPTPCSTAICTFWRTRFGKWLPDMAFVCWGKWRDLWAGASALSPWTWRLWARSTGVLPVASAALGQASAKAPFFQQMYYKIILYPIMKAEEDICFQLLLILSSTLIKFILIRHERDLCLHLAAKLTFFPR